MDIDYTLTVSETQVITISACAREGHLEPKGTTDSSVNEVSFESKKPIYQTTQHTNSQDKRMNNSDSGNETILIWSSESS